MAKKNGNQEVAEASYLDGYQGTGAGVATDAKDFLIPMAKVLQANSPEVIRGPNKVEDAEAGDVLIKGRPVIKGGVGFLFQPVYRENAVVEWLPRDAGGGGGGGFVARHPENFFRTSTDWGKDENNEFRRFRRSNRNLLVETRYVGGYLIGEHGEAATPLMLTFASTGHSVAKDWNTATASKRMPNGTPADLWMVYYRIKTRLKTRRDQSWFIFDIKDAGPLENGMPKCVHPPTQEDADRGKHAFESFSVSGLSQFAAEETPTPAIESEPM